MDALDRWDLEAVDPAILDFARLATPEQLSELLFRYSTRDLREIGHKAIAVQNVHRLLPIVGPEYAPPVLRSLAAALQNHGNDPNPATRDLPSESNLAGVPRDAWRNPEDLETGPSGRRRTQ